MIDGQGAPVPRFDEMVAFYQDEQHAPANRSTLVHGDYRIGNLMWHKTEPRVIGVLDWELTTIGHPPTSDGEPCAHEA